MCWQDHNSKTTLNNDILKKNIDWTQVEKIELQGGEILAMKGAKELYIWLTKRMNKKVDIITNGRLINDEWADNLVNGSDQIEISVNASTKKTHELVNKGSNYEIVINNIRKLIQLKYKHNLNTKIVYKYTIVTENIHEFTDAIKLANSSGCDSITFGCDKRMLSFLNENPKLKENIKKELSSINYKELKVHVNTKILKWLGLL